MPLVNCVFCLWQVISYAFVNHALLLSLNYSLLKLGVCVHKMPRWIKHMPSLLCVNPKDSAGHNHLVLHQVKLSTTNVIFEKREMNERLYVEQVGVDLEPCVHAHGPDVYLIMEASLKIIIPLL